MPFDEMLTSTKRNRAAISSANALPIRSGERRDWNAYARRTVDFGFGVPGSQLAHAVELRRGHLLGIEGRSHEVGMVSRGRRSVADPPKPTPTCTR
jgi:hypothetical protein